MSDVWIIERICCSLGKQTKKTVNTALRYGAPGVELTGLHKETATVTQMHFLHGQVTSMDFIYIFSFRKYFLDQVLFFNHFLD